VVETGFKVGLGPQPQGWFNCPAFPTTGFGSNADAMPSRRAGNDVGLADWCCPAAATAEALALLNV
jgi:hypothetical protein